MQSLISILKNLLNISQLLLAKISYFSCIFLIPWRAKEKDWIICAENIANNAYLIKSAIKNSVSCVLYKNKYYNSKFDYPKQKKISVQQELFFKYVKYPILFGYLAFLSKGFIWIGNQGFFIGSRKSQHKFLKTKKKKQVFFFCGTDIRSPAQMKKIEKKTKLENIATYLPVIKHEYQNREYEKQKKETARLANLYADLIFTHKTDQKGYLTKKTLPFFYFYPKKNFNFCIKKFQNTDMPLILHAPSSPIIKGTPLVRAAVKKLSIEGYKFSYRELNNAPNRVVISWLKRSHIVLNEFYAFVPGLFGIEAMANCCCLLTSADEKLESDLPPGSNRAWCVTRYFEIYDKLKMLLLQPKLMKKQAEAGYQWALEHAAISNTGPKLRKILDSIPEKTHYPGGPTYTHS